MMLSNAKIKMILKSTTAMTMISILDRRPEIVSDRLVYSPPCEIKKKWRENSNICHQERSQPSSSIVIDRRPTLLNIVQHARVFFE